MTILWTSEAIRISDAVCFDVKANHGVVLGLYVGDGEVAADFQFTPNEARSLAQALTSAACMCDAAPGGAA